MHQTFTGTLQLTSISVKKKKRVGKFVGIANLGMPSPHIARG
jgi:hypothetical protein